MDSKANLKITSFNCLGFKFRNYEYIKQIFNECNILILQETWLYNFEHKNILNVIPNCQYYAVSSMDEHVLRSAGRPYGGLAVLWHRNLGFSV